MFSVADDTLTLLLALAKEYQVDHIRTKCEQYIGAQMELGVLRLDECRKWLTADRLLLFLLSCDQYDLKEHCEQLKEIAAGRQTSELTSCSNYRHFPRNSAMDVFRIRCEKLEKEAQKYVFGYEQYRSK